MTDLIKLTYHRTQDAAVIYLCLNVCALLLGFIGSCVFPYRFYQYAHRDWDVTSKTLGQDFPGEYRCISTGKWKYVFPAYCLGANFKFWMDK